MSQQGHRWRRNQGYVPDEEQRELWERCAVCGWWIDAERTQESEGFQALSQTTTGTVYRPATGSGVEGWTTKDKQTVTNIARGVACPMCGSGNWRGARGKEGLAG